ncbi:hypothetical protein C0Q70_14982 [Pomacea canaliculata]|uniref:Uncharacterized protein n=1 Tax=Pomacea canaliculata TaxID=400727 RepID=A0A2T7NTK4_POMCA|nr:hypothetical protein C0Q70_14982 [Pomacea canaliculata]
MVAGWAGDWMSSTNFCSIVERVGHHATRHCLRHTRVLEQSNPLMKAGHKGRVAFTGKQGPQLPSWTVGDDRGRAHVTSFESLLEKERFTPLTHFCQGHTVTARQAFLLPCDVTHGLTSRSGSIRRGRKSPKWRFPPLTSPRDHIPKI